MNKSTRPFSFANPSFFPAALAAAMMIASSRSAFAEPVPAAENERAQESFLRPVSGVASLCISAPRMESSLPP